MTTVRYTTINGEVIAEKRNGVRRLYVPDPLGSTVALVDNTQTQVDTFNYWPYGEVRSSTGTTPPPYQFVGTKGYYAGNASKTYVRARYLDVPKGRWLTQDPISFLGGDANLYRDVSNNPVVYKDPWGLQSGLDPAPQSPPTRQKPPFPPPPGQMWCYDIYTREWKWCPDPNYRPPGSPGDPRIPPPIGSVPPLGPSLNPPNILGPGGPKYQIPIGGPGFGGNIGGNFGGGKQKSTLDCQLIYIHQHIGVSIGFGPDEQMRCCFWLQWGGGGHKRSK